ncbi:hypothetical protein CKA32_005693 [Geitlerinema sp. FC II]|nr:hypothetical protein CKA32_005693 [Geitlerinema sp. FC II]
MRQRSFAAFGLTLAVVLGGCGSPPEEQATPEATETPTAEEVPVDGETTAEGETPEAQPFETPVVEEQQPMATAPSGLTTSTNPQERARQVQRAIEQQRQQAEDPFGVLPVEPVRTEEELQEVETGAPAPRDGEAADGEAADGETVAVGPPLPPLTPQTIEPLPDINPQDFRLPRLEPPGAQIREEGEGTTAADGTGIPGNLPPAVTDGTGATDGEEMPSQPMAPPPPSTDLAQAVEVTGVMQLGNEIQIIVQTPDSPFGRYVRVGDLIANGRVRVVRVERLQGEPIVILEQNGVEVAREIGQPGVSPVEESETAGLATHRSASGSHKFGQARSLVSSR